MNFYSDTIKSKGLSTKNNTFANLKNVSGTKTNYFKVFNRNKNKLDSTHLEVPKLPAGSDSAKALISKSLIDKKDTIVAKPSVLKNFKTIFPKGTLSVGYDYGFLPYSQNSPSISTAIRSEGSLQTDVFNIPINISYFYTTQKNLIGLTNYFKISYDAERYKDKLNSKLSNNLELYKHQLGKLNAERQHLLQKMAYTDYLSTISPEKWPIDLESKASQLSSEALIGTSNLKNLGAVPDSAAIANDIISKSGAGKFLSKADSIRQQVAVFKSKADSVIKLYRAYENKYDALNDSIKNVQSKISEIENMVSSGNNMFLHRSPYFSKAQNFFSGVKKLDIGLCYPGYSTFLANNIPVRGVNFEYQKNNLFFGFTYGTTVSTLMYSPKSAEGILVNVKNSLNYFDLNNVSAGRKILSAKFGSGTKERDHFFIGFLIGKGASTYSPTTGDITPRGLETNLVIEADARKKIGKVTSLDLIIGKSSLQNADLTIETIHTAAKEIFSSFRSYAALVRINTQITSTKTNLTASVRWVDPFFNSFGIGFIRYDNMRYELKLDQPLSKQLRYTVALRYEEDNLLKLLNYKNTFYSVNNTISYKIKRGLMLRAGYTPLYRSLNGEDLHQHYKSSIVTGILTFTPKCRNALLQFNILYNRYLVNTDSTPINFQNFSYSHQITFKKGFKTGLNISWFKNSLKDSTGNNVLLGVLDGGYQFKNGSGFSAGVKCAYKTKNGFFPGYVFKSLIKLSGSLFWENQAEKFIVGDLFNGYNLAALKKFPYCFTTKLILNF